MNTSSEQEQEPSVELCPLPAGWSWVSLGELGLVRLGKTPRKSDYRDFGDHKIVKFRDVDEHGHVDWHNPVKGFVDSSPEVIRTLKDLQKNDVLVTSSAHMSEHIGKKVGIVANIPNHFKGAYVVGEILQVRAREDIDPKWILYYLRSTDGYKAIQRRVHGVHLISSRAQNIEIPVAPLDQQKRIVAEIEKQFSRLDEAVANLKRVKANLKRYKATVLKAAVEGVLVAPKATSADFSKQNWRPIGLAISTLDQGWSPQCESEPAESDETWAVMKTTAVQPLRFMDKENKRLPPAHDPRTKLELAAGDLLITRAGPRSRVGVACLVKTTRPHLMLCDKAYRLRVKPDVAMAGFLEIVLNSPDMLDALDELKTGISDSGLNLTQKRFKELLVPLPPLVEQSRVVAEVERNLSLADEAEVQVNANLQRADRLRQSILMRAFTGGICVGEPSCGPLPNKGAINVQA